ncbi:hypothetical protein [Streptomyces sp. NPDC058268]|uniref:hypothetical protein n=1 Tax=Streptomyces sp. NPDC058268 TaxID=3346413 RepID=UPI0036E3290C
MWKAFGSLTTLRMAFSIAEEVSWWTETLRALRDSRRATYASYATAIDRYLDKLSTTLIPLRRVERFPDQR